ncbi:MAG: flagellar M-ring protein FliF [Candidatus Eisenbacteria bacterium]|uniref:Flagellar M-ring protein n=1 Tax=Eiseniibacteriota bacterium TaxID=2212470 RepID=A0A849SJN1_UNCEI|nr:flagellar M-ring protein FliF [Candidatus Eisenbacteria bacterium]
MASIVSNENANGLQSLLSGRRLPMLLAAAAAVAIIWVVANWATAPNYVTLYRDLELAEAAQLGDHLEKAGIAHRLEGGGTEVQVASAEIARARVALAKDGLPMSGRPGLELFDKPTWGMTEFAQRVTFQRALEGELARTIKGLRGVKDAQVHLVLPVSSALRRLERPATASVVLTLEPNSQLPPETVQGITYVVSSSVEQLTSDHVAIMDDAGRVLSAPTVGTGSAGLTTRQLEVQRAVESNVVTKIEALLATVVGVGRSRAEVSAELSFDQVDETVETFDPETQVLQQEQRSEAPAGATDQPNVVSNTYQNSRRIERKERSVGDVRRLSVAVLVDQVALREAATKQAGLSIASIESMVRNAAGIDSARGDRLTVLEAPFGSVLPLDVAAAGSKAPGVDVIQVAERVSRPVAGMVAILALVLLAFRAFGSLGAPARRAAEPAPAASVPLTLPTLTPPPVLSPSARTEPNSNSNADRADDAALVLRAWLENEA